MPRLPAGLATGAVLLVFGCLSAGCSGAHLYDAGKDRTAAAARTALEAAAPADALADAHANLTVLLEAELEAVRTNRRQLFDLNLLRLAADANRPVARLARDSGQRLAALGFEEAAAARAFLAAGGAGDVSDTAMRDAQARARSLGGPDFPACRAARALPDALPAGWQAGLASAQQRAVELEYASYRRRCAEARDDAGLPAGALKRARANLLGAERALASLRRTVAEGRRAAADQRKTVDAARSAGEAGDAAGRARAAAADAGERLDQGRSAARQLGLEHPVLEQIDAVQTVLRAVADGSLTRATQPAGRLRAAAGIAAEVPGLAQDMAELRARARAPSVANLLVALNHLKIQVAHDEARLLLAERRVELRRRQYRARLDELRHTLAVHDQLCSYAVQATGAGHPGAACDGFTVALAAQPAGAPASVRCALDDAPLDPCPLARSFREGFESADPPAERRALFLAVRALAGAHDARTAAIEADYRLIHLTHQEALAGNRMALQAYENLVAVPVGEIAEYHAAGIRPAEIGSLLVQALGFTAVTAGIVASD